MTDTLDAGVGQAAARRAAVPTNAAWLLIARLAAQGFAVVTTVLLARRLGLVGLGEYAFVSAVVFLANVATTFGTDMVLIRDVAGDGRTDRWGAVLLLQLALSAAAAGAIWLAAGLLPASRQSAASALRILSLALGPAAFFSVATAMLRGVGRLRAYAGLSAFAAAAPLAGVAAFLRRGDDVVRAATVLLVAQSVVAVVGWIVGVTGVPELRAAPRVARGDTMAMARASAAVGGLGLVGVVYQRLAAVVVALFVGPAASGWYSGASRVVDASKTGHVALFGAVYPTMAEAGGDGGEGGDDDGRTRSLTWSRRACVALGAAVSAALLLAGPLLVSRLYGPAFEPARRAVMVLALGVVPSTVATYQSLLFLGARREHDTLRVMLASLAVLIGALLVLVPTIGWIGACWAVVVADTAQAVLMRRARRRGGGDRRDRRVGTP